ncbi:hypothetical protein Hanom_Chr00s024709g01763941 [Helianthus anomalus]
MVKIRDVFWLGFELCSGFVFGFGSNTVDSVNTRVNSGQQQVKRGQQSKGRVSSQISGQLGWLTQLTRSTQSNGSMFGHAKTW